MVQKKICFCMKMYIVTLLIAISVLASCNNNNSISENKKDMITQQPVSGKDGDNKGSDSSLKNNPVLVNVRGCYMKLLQRDTMILHLEQNGDDVTGKMIFDNYQKDGSSGTVHGKVKGDVIQLWYNFTSEGMNSVMELFFRKQDKGVVRGIGPVDAKKDTAYFTDHSAIYYPENQTFNKIDCAEVPAKYN